MEQLMAKKLLEQTSKNNTMEKNVEFGHSKVEVQQTYF